MADADARRVFVATQTDIDIRNRELIGVANDGTEMRVPYHLLPYYLNRSRDKDKTHLIVAEKDLPLAYLELDDETLGRFARKHLIACEEAFRKRATATDMPLSLVTSMHGSIALYRLVNEAGADHAQLDHSGVTWPGHGPADWRITIERVKPDHG